MVAFLLLFTVVCLVEITYGDVYPRNVTKVLEVNNPVQDIYGAWHGPQFCATGFYTNGFELKIQSFQHAGDDTAVNAILLSCGHYEDATMFGGFIESGEGNKGSFGAWKRCATNEFLVGYELNVEKHRPAWDTTAVVNAKFWCRQINGGTDTELDHPFLDHEDRWGQWTGFSGLCPVGSAICGMKSRIDDQGHVGLVDAHFYCCGRD